MNNMVTLIAALFGYSFYLKGYMQAKWEIVLLSLIHSTEILDNFREN